MAGIIRRTEVPKYRKGYRGSVRFLWVSGFSVLSGSFRFFFPCCSTVFLRDTIGNERISSDEFRSGILLP
jgi:hypothetical protein